jgi:hypothetical protein
VLDTRRHRPIGDHRNLLTQGLPSGRQLALTSPALAVSDNTGCPLSQGSSGAGQTQRGLGSRSAGRQSRELGERVREAEIVVLSSYVPSAH